MTRFQNTLCHAVSWMGLLSILLGATHLSGCAVPGSRTGIPSPTIKPPILTDTRLPNLSTTLPPLPTVTSQPTAIPSIATVAECEQTLNRFIQANTDPSGQVMAPADMGQKLDGVPRTWNEQQKQEIANKFAQEGEQIVANIIQDSQSLPSRVYIDEIKLGMDKGYGYRLVKAGQTVWAVDNNGNYLRKEGLVGQEVTGYEPVPADKNPGTESWGELGGCTLLMKENRFGYLTAIFHPLFGRWESFSEPEIPLDPVEKEKVTSAGLGLDFFMRMKEAQAERQYLEILDTFRFSKVNTRFWQELNVPATRQGTVDFLKNSYGPDGENYWMPLVSPKGTRFKTLQSKIHESGIFRDWTPVIEGQVLDSVKLDGIRWIMYGRKQWAADTGQIRELRDQLDNINGSSCLLYSYDIASDSTLRTNESGLMVTPDRRIAFIMGNQRDVPPKNVYGNALLGGRTGDFRTDMDPRVATAMWKTYWGAFRELSNTDPRRVPICIETPSICHYGFTIDQIQPGQVIFEPVQ